MEKEFIPYELALALKELGFDELCIGYYYNGKIYFNSQGVNLPGPSGEQPLPLYQQTFRWFREKYELYSWITMELGNKSTFCWVLSGEHTRTQYAAYFYTYEEAELACLSKLIEIVKNLK